MPKVAGIGLVLAALAIVSLVLAAGAAAEEPVGVTAGTSPAEAVRMAWREACGRQPASRRAHLAGILSR